MDIRYKPFIERILFIVNAHRIPEAAAKLVFNKMRPTLSLKPKVLAPLNPNQANHRIKTPSTANGILDLRFLIFPLFPTTINPAKAINPAVVWTTVAPTKSINPKDESHVSCFKNSPPHTQCP